MRSIQWTEVHDCLQMNMKRELETIRQLLANMGLEEQFILRKEQRYWGSMMEERSLLITQLGQIRQNRMGIIERLAFITQRENRSLEDLLPPQDMNSWEVLSLRDQMLILLDRMNLQMSRNQMLLHFIRESVMPPVTCKKIKKNVATLPPGGYTENETPK